MEVEGFDELSRKLEKLPAKVFNKTIQSATTSAIREGAKQIRKDAPRGKYVTSVQKKYGYKKLHKSIGVKRLKPQKKYERAASIHTGNAFWVRFIEFGTRYLPAKPFFAKAFRNSEQAILQKLEQKIGDAIEKEAMKK